MSYSGIQTSLLVAAKDLLITEHFCFAKPCSGPKPIVPDAAPVFVSLAQQISLCLSQSMNESDVFRALSDPTRRAVFDRLLAGEKNATRLREGLEISQPAVSQHIAVLRSAGLINEERAGRHVNYSLNPDGLRPLFDWLTRYRAFWPDRVDRLKTLLKEMDQ